MSSEVSALVEFFRENHIDFVQASDVKSLIEANYDSLNEDVLKLLVSKAIKERDDNLKNSATLEDQQLLGCWGIIIDEIRTLKVKRQELAVKNISVIMSFRDDTTPQNLIKYLRDLHTTNQLDLAFVQILENSLEECVKHNHEDSASVYKFALDVVYRLQSSPKPISSQPAAIHSANISNQNDNTEKNKIPSSTEDNNSCSQEFSMESLESSGMLLNQLMTESSGDAMKLKEKLLNILQKNDKKLIDPDAFLKILNDNIDACRIAGYVNKLKLFEFIKAIITTYQQDIINIHSNKKRTNSDNVNGDENDEDISDILSAHHAPQFVDSNNKKRRNKLNNKLSTSNEVEESEEDIIDILKPDTFIIGTNLMSNLLHTNIKNMKKKTEKKIEKQKAEIIIQQIVTSLQNHSYAVIDNFLPIDLIKRVRIESGLFMNYYEQSEIWVGKEADVGAHIQVPSVRGDKVLWICGGHDKKNSNSAPETGGGTRVVKSLGELEPCKMEIKKSAPIKKFSAMKEMIAAIDTLVNELKLVVPKLNHIYERSDAMFALYPGEGSRFAKHIDNTTQDGRRLTVLVYLNPDWKPEQGGALRITPATITDNNNNNSNNNTIVTLSETQVIDILPIGGRVALFYSSEIPHEVLPSFGQRHAITIWYYDSLERLNALKKAKESGRATIAAKSSVETQTKVKQFMSDLMGGNDITDNGGDPTQEELAILSNKVKLLPIDVLTIVANITGAPSADSFRQGFELLSVQDLKSMRALFRRMGLN